MRIIECQQLTPEWWEARRGVPTASNFNRIVTSTGKVSAGQEGYIAELIGDMVMQLPQYFSTQGKPVTRAMTNGQDLEPEARRAYEIQMGASVQQVGFCLHDSGLFGASPDGLIGDDGVLELKVPEPKTQAAYLLKGKLPTAYIQQVHGQLLVTGRKYVDFYSYQHGLEPLHIRVEPNDFTEKLRCALEEFLTKLAEAKAKLITRTEQRTMPAADKPKKKPSVEEVLKWFRENIPLAPQAKTRTPEDQLAWLADHMARLDKEVGFTKEQGDELGCLWYQTAFAVASTPEKFMELRGTASKHDWNPEQFKTLSDADKAAVARLGMDA